MENILIIIQTIELELIFLCTIINGVYIVTLISGPFGFSECVYSVVWEISVAQNVSILTADCCNIRTYW